MVRAAALSLLCALALTLAVASAASAATTTGPIPFSVTASSTTVGTTTSTTPFAAPPGQPELTGERASAIFLADPKVKAWLDRYPRVGRTQQATYDTATLSWTVKVWWGAAGEIAQGRVDDRTKTVIEAWTGPQVAWGMARGNTHAIFGGTLMNRFWFWLALCGVFVVGLADFRRPLSLRNLDLVVLVSFSASLWYFNIGHVLTSVPLVYPPLVYLLLRTLWIGIRGRPAPGRPVWPAVVLLGATIFLAGLRIGMVVWNGNVIDVGYSGVIGAERIAHGQAPYGNFPIEGDLKPCGPKDSSGEIRQRIQTNGRCEAANPQGDTYGPVGYLSYLPGYGLFGWSGKWDKLPAVRFTSIFFDALCIIGLFLVGRRFGGLALASSLSFAWVAYPFTLWAADANTNDMLVPAFLIWGFWLVSSNTGRGIFVALSGWTKFVALIVAPLWLTYPDRRPKRGFLVGFAVATAAAFSVLLLEPNPIHEARVFWDRTVSWQIGRDSPFSLWDWRQYHARGLPDLHLVQRVLQALVVAAALALPFWPRRKSPLQLAALTGTLLLGFELVLTHWYYGYIDWFFAFVAIPLLAPRAQRAAAREDAAEEVPVAGEPLPTA